MCFVFSDSQTHFCLPASFSPLPAAVRACQGVFTLRYKVVLADGSSALYAQMFSQFLCCERLPDEIACKV